MLLKKTKQNPILTGLDIGTTKVCAIIGQADEEGKLTILGMGSCPSRGLRCGEIVEIQPTVDAIHRATQRAMEVANVPITDIYVGIAGEHIRGMNSEAVVEIRHPARGIDEKDRARAIQKAAGNISLPDDQALIQYVVQEFRVNDGKPTHNPIGLSGSSLRVRAHLVTGCVDSLQNTIKVVRKAGFRQPHIVLQSLASSMSVISPHELELGVVLIDIGGGTTDISVSFDGAVRTTGEIPMGGDYITRDVAEVLCCRPNDAENIKKRIGCALPALVERERTFQLPSASNENQLVPHKEHQLAEIIETRLDDIFELVRDFLDKTGYRSRLHAGAVLTGGTALLPGITDVAERILEMKCRCGAPQGLKGFGHVVSSPIYATGVGLIYYGLDEQRRNSHRRNGFRRFMDFLDDNFV